MNYYLKTETILNVCCYIQSCFIAAIINARLTFAEFKKSISHACHKSQMALDIKVLSQNVTNKEKKLTHSYRVKCILNYYIQHQKSFTLFWSCMLNVDTNLLILHVKKLILFAVNDKVNIVSTNAAVVFRRRLCLLNVVLL